MKSNKPSVIPPALYRQGDVAIERIDALPANLTPSPLDPSGRVVLAHGVSTGHNHAFLPGHATKFTDAKGGAEFFAVEGPDGVGLLTHDEHSTISIPNGYYAGGNSANGTVRQREYTPTEIRNVQD